MRPMHRRQRLYMFSRLASVIIRTGLKWLHYIHLCTAIFLFNYQILFLFLEPSNVSRRRQNGKYSAATCCVSKPLPLSSEPFQAAKAMHRRHCLLWPVLACCCGYPEWLWCQVGGADYAAHCSVCHSYHFFHPALLLYCGKQNTTLSIRSGEKGYVNAVPDGGG